MSELLEVRNLDVRFPVKSGRRLGRDWVHAVDDVSFTLRRGETLGLVGESGSGKSTVAHALIRLVPATGGEVLLGGEDVLHARGARLRDVRRRMAMVFQDPLASLDPRRTVRESVRDPLEIHRLHAGRREERVTELMDLVGLPARFADHYPHELSGGQRQRVCIARALASEPEVVILDEATASLDVSVQAQILNLLRRLQDELGIAYVFISHDLASVEHVSHRVQVMYLGRLMESAPSRVLYAETAHPYTQALLSAVPHEDPRVERSRSRILLGGDLPSPVSPPSGCVFRTRCPLAVEACAEHVPPAFEVGPDHVSACLRIDEARALRPA